MSDQDYATVNGTKVHKSDFAHAPEGSKPSEWKLPIHDAAHVRNALARWNQTELPAAARAGVFARIVRAAKKFGVKVSEEAGELPIADCRMTNEGNRKSSIENRQLSEVRNGLVRIAVAYTGEFERDGKNFSITPKDLEEMAANLNEREVPIDYEHQSALGVAPPGWARAAGWVRKPAEIESGRWQVVSGKQAGSPLATNPSPLILWAWAELTPACLAMIKQKEYRYFSPEIHWHDVNERGKRIGTRLAAGAMTNRPFLKNLPPIELSDEDYNGLFGLGSRQSAEGRPLLAMVALSESRESKIENGSTSLTALSGQSKGRKSKIGLLDLDSVHVPSASKAVSVAYHQTEEQSGKGRVVGAIHESLLPLATDRSPLRTKEKIMAKKFSFRKLTEGEHAGKFGLYKSDVLMMDEGEPMVFDDEDFPAVAGALPDGCEAGASPGPTADGEDDSGGAQPAAPGGESVAASEARRLAEVFREGRVDLGRASALAAEGRIALAAVFRAQAAEKLVDRFIAEGKLLPKRRAAAFRLALEDEAGLRALLSDARPMVDFRSWGLAGAAHLAGSAQTELDEMVRQWIGEHNTDYSAALSEVTRRNPELWQRASAEVSERARAGEDEES
jgi:phage I-like protein